MPLNTCVDDNAMLQLQRIGHSWCRTWNGVSGKIKTGDNEEDRGG